jgi:hypothetical protein
MKKTHNRLALRSEVVLQLSQLSTVGGGWPATNTCSLHCSVIGVCASVNGPGCVPSVANSPEC